MPRKRPRRPCQYTYPDGSPCAQFAQRNGDFCRSHDPDKPAPNIEGPGSGNHNAIRHGYYSDYFSDEDLMAIATIDTSQDLEDEIAIVRLTLRRLAAQISQDLSVRETVAVAGVLLEGAGKVAALLKARRALSGDAADGISGAIAKALDELGAEWGIDL
jgi:hypothetical protein